MNQIIFSRVIAGFGGGGLQLMSNVVIQDLVAPQKRGQYQSYVSSVQTLGIALGSPLGGFITDTFGWRYCFKLNILPLIGIGYFYVFHFTNYNVVTEKKTDDGDHEVNNRKNNNNATVEHLLLWEKLGSIDFLGAFILAVGNLAFAITVLLGGNTREWTDPLITATMVTTILSFILFGLYQTYWARSPLISRTCIANRNVVFSSLAYFFICMSNGSVDSTVPQFFMGVLGFSTSQSGLWTMMNALAVPIGCYCAGNYIRYQGRFLSMVILGFGFGSSLVSLLVAVTSDVSSKDVASAMSIMMLFRSMGLLYGTAIASSIIQCNLKVLLESRINGPSAEQLIRFIRTSIREVHTLSPRLQQLVANVLGQSLQKAYLFMALSCMVAILPILYLRDTNLKNEQPTAPNNKRITVAAVVAVTSDSS
ncbi:major facilitator superfamily domain-containing protein [Zychaea mexicana]|uniref:major facilitator superfamily domain-containing protein n=1 Tax=Zychaea mexicana TaxID=64656 RepID=UPI0022FDCB28|nr:major facilitator superfamily domain-containing protein [Zychaea mexicana]KAI9493750.1 major facilitator superfamily domain-containing protein [Zychaea mexicana]